MIGLLFQNTKSFDYCVYQTKKDECSGLGYQASLIVQNPVSEISDIYTMTSARFSKEVTTVDLGFFPEHLVSFTSENQLVLKCSQERSFYELVLDLSQIKSMSFEKQIRVYQLISKSASIDNTKYSLTNIKCDQVTYNGDLSTDIEFSGYTIDSPITIECGTLNKFSIIENKPSVLLVGEKTISFPNNDIFVKTFAKTIDISFDGKYCSEYKNVVILLMKSDVTINVDGSFFNNIDVYAFTFMACCPHSTVTFKGNLNDLKYGFDYISNYEDTQFIIQNTHCLCISNDDSACPNTYSYISQAPSLSYESYNQFIKLSHVIYAVSDNEYVHPSYIDEKPYDIVHGAITIKPDEVQTIPFLNLSSKIKVEVPAGVTLTVEKLYLPQNLSDVHIKGTLYAVMVIYPFDTSVDFSTGLSNIFVTSSVTMRLYNNYKQAQTLADSVWKFDDITIKLNPSYEFDLDLYGQTNDLTITPVSNPTVITARINIYTDYAFVIPESAQTATAINARLCGTVYSKLSLDKIETMYEYGDFSQILPDFCIYAPGQESKCPSDSTKVAQADVEFDTHIKKDDSLSFNVIVNHDITLSLSQIQASIGLSMYALDNMGAEGGSARKWTVLNNAKITISEVEPISVLTLFITMSTPVVFEPKKESSAYLLTVSPGSALNPRIIEDNKNWKFIQSSLVSYYTDYSQIGEYIVDGLDYPYTIVAIVCNVPEEETCKISLEMNDTIVMHNVAVKISQGLMAATVSFMTVPPANIKIEQKNCNTTNACVTVPAYSGHSLTFGSSFNSKSLTPFVWVDVSDSDDEFPMIYTGNPDLNYLAPGQTMEIVQSLLVTEIDDNGENGLPTWAIAVIVVACVVVVAGAVVGVLFCTKKLTCKKGPSVDV